MTTCKNSSSTHRRLFWYQIAVLVLSLGIIVMGYQNWRLSTKPPFKPLIQQNAAFDQSELPFYNQIMEIINPLVYSGTQSLTSGRVSLSIDFANKSWTLHNLHRYDSNGHIILDDYRFGLCGELAEYTQSRIKPLLPSSYSIVFGQVAESGFFLAPRATHIVLLIRDAKTNETFLVDPTFKRYGRLEDFQEYLFFGYSTTLVGLNQKDPDVSFPVDHSTPLSIRNDFISSLLVGSVDGKFDKDNFVISIRANKKYKYSGRTIFAVRKKNGEPDTFEDKWMMDELLTAEVKAALKRVLTEWFYDLEQTGK